MQEGRIVRGPNGERGIIQSGRIVPLQGSASQQGAGVPQMIVPPQPKAPPPRHPEQAEGDRLSNDQKRRDLNTRFQTLTPEQVAQRGLNPGVAYQVNVATGEINSLGELPKSVDPAVREREANKARTVISTVDRALGRANDWTTGWGSVLANVPSTDARGLRGDLVTIKANLGFDELQAMRAASPTGGALGQVAVQELEALQATLGNLDQAQDDSDVRRNLEQIRTHYTNWYKAVYGKEPNQAPGFTDDQRRQILEYLPQAKSEEDLINFARNISRREDGATIVGNPKEVLNYVRGGGDPSRLKFDDPYKVESTSQLPGGGEEIEFLGFED